MQQKDGSSKVELKSNPQQELMAHDGAHASSSSGSGTSISGSWTGFVLNSRHLEFATHVFPKQKLDQICTNDDLPLDEHTRTYIYIATVRKIVVPRGAGKSCGPKVGLINKSD